MCFYVATVSDLYVQKFMLAYMKARIYSSLWVDTAGLSYSNKPRAHENRSVPEEMNKV